MSERSMKHLMKGAAWLTAASLISKILSAVYRVPFQNMVGDVGFYIFQQVYPIYGIAMTLALGGFPVVISKMLAEANGDLRRQQIIMRAVFRTLRIVSITLFIFLFLFADLIAMMMGDPALSELIRVISFVFLLMPYLAFMRGFFQSTGEMVPTAISQTIEQIIRVAIILLGAGLALNMGLDLYDAGSMAMSGAIFGGVSGIFVLRHFYNKKLASGQGLQPAVFAGKQEKIGIGRDFLRQSMAICVVSSMLILFQLVDSFQVYRLMSDSGIPDFIAKSLKGIYDRGQPILQLGLVLSTGLALALVPMITAARVQGQQKELKRSILLAIKITLILSGAETVGLIVIMRPLNQMLFQTPDGTFVLQLFMPAVFLSSLIVMLSSILQGFGKIIVPAIGVGIGLVVKWVTGSVLIPHYATVGASISTCIGLAVVLLICYVSLKETIRIPFVEKSMLFRLIAALILMAIIPCLIEWLVPFETRFGSAFQAIISALLGGGVFLVFALRYKLLGPKDFVFLPFGSKLLALSKLVAQNKKVGE